MTTTIHSIIYSFTGSIHGFSTVNDINIYPFVYIISEPDENQEKQNLSGLLVLRESVQQIYNFRIVFKTYF